MTPRNKHVPDLRFPEFSGHWNERTLGEYLTFKNGINADKSQYGQGKKFINVLDIINNDGITHEKILGRVSVSEEEFKKYEVKYGDILFQRSSETREETGQSNVYLDKEQSATFGGFVIRGQAIQEYNPVFFHYLLKTSSTREEITTKSGGSTRYNVSQDILKEVRISLPTPPEQEKIAAFFTAVDEKTQRLAKKKALLEVYKKGVMQKIFNQEIRFKDDDGNDFDEWEEKSLDEMLTEHKTRNTVDEVSEVFSVAKHKGVINQIEHLGRSYSADDTSNYKVAFPDDVIYTKSPTSDFPFGIVKQNKTGRTGIVSVLYAVFRPANKNVGTLLDYYFSNPIKTYNYLNPLVRKGAKNTMNIGNDDFLNGSKISFPVSLTEQKKIAEFISLLDEKIRLVERQLERTKEFKKGLLQQMFI